MTGNMKLSTHTTSGVTSRIDSGAGAHRNLMALALGCSLLGASFNVHSAGTGWSIVPHFGLSQLGDQSGSFAGAADIADGGFDVALDNGFAAGLSVRHDYAGSRWTSEFGWEYRSNDSKITTSDGETLSAGNYASNTFFVNGRYALTEGTAVTPWVGAGLSVIQEVDLDSEGAGPERSFSDSGEIGVQVMAGADYDITDRFYLTGEIRYTGFSGIDMQEERGNAGQVSNIDYKPLTIGIGLGFRF